MKAFHYVYILVSETDNRLHYSGITAYLNARLAEHNRGKCPHTAKYSPWKVETAVAFRSAAKARDFERYLRLAPAGNSLVATFDGSSPTRSQPFTPKPRLAVWISASIIVKHTDELSALCHIGRLPIPRSNRLKHVVAVA